MNTLDAEVARRAPGAAWSGRCTTGAVVTPSRPDAPWSGFLRAALGFYALAICLGVVLRVAFVHPLPWLHFGHALHAHSHTLYFGWAGLAVFALAFRHIGARDRLVQAVLVAIVVLAGATFVAFLSGGYATPGLVVSGLSLPIWITAALVFWRRARGDRRIETTYLRVGVVYLLASFLGAGARVAFLVTGVDDPLLPQLAVFGFLHLFACFFQLAVTGLVAGVAQRAGAPLDPVLLRRQLLIYAPLAWLTFPLGVAGGGEGMLGLVARAAALGLIVPGLMLVWNLLGAARRAHAPLAAGLRGMAAWVTLQVVLEGAGALVGTDVVAFRTPVVLFLHVALVGVVTTGLALALFAGRARLVAHHVGLAVMVVGLGLSSAPAVGLPAAWLGPGQWLSLAGGAIIAAAGLAWLVRATVMPARRAPLEPGRGRLAHE
jgi:hypothetical protein